MYKSAPEVIFLAPGGGLGHLTRACALSCELKNYGVESMIISTSRFGRAIAQITRTNVVGLPADNWGMEIVNLVRSVKPKLVVIDSFPFGFKNEKLSELADDFTFIYLARHLKIEKYLEDKTWDYNSKLIRNTIILESLIETHKECIEQSNGSICVLKSPISLELKNIDCIVPQKLKNLFLSHKKIHLIVHSGSENELNVLIDRAEQAVKEENEGTIIIVTNRMINTEYYCSDFYPAASLYPECYRIYTGAGYNSIAEGNRFFDKHVAVAFNRIYDDQSYRIDNRCLGSENGCQKAAEYINSILCRNNPKCNWNS